MPPYGSEPEGRGKRRDIVFAGVVLVLAFYTTYLAPSTQQGIANVLQATVLRPFIATQVRLGDARLRA
ncbi:MAG: hypothetical protein KJO65_04245, partial [Gemmatimonadetes bacterium]|nr:hypothetical protein [Gemmatimonadota bacterium]